MYNGFMYDFCDYQKTEVCITECRAPVDTIWKIPEIIDGRPVVEIAASAFYERDDVESVYIPDSVAWIGTEAFRKCKNLKSVTFYPTNYTAQAVEIRDGAFQDCAALNTFSISIPVYIRDCAFMYCADLDMFKAKILSAGKKSFGKCAKLRAARFGKNAAWEANSFEGCKALSHLVFYENIADHIPHYVGKMKLLKGKIISCTPNFNHLDLSYAGYNIDVSL